MKFPELTVSAVILNEHNQVLLCRSHKWDDKYIIPGGHVEYGERLEDALRREILEETALTIRDIRLIGIKESLYSNTFYKDRHFLFVDYLCRADSTEVILNDEAEEYAWVSFDELSKYELGGFTESLLSKVQNPADNEGRVEIFYNYI